MDLQKKYNRKRTKLSQVGLILQGTIVERYIERPCTKTGKVSRTGPYYQWTRKKDGRSVTVNLSRDQYNLFQAAINENRKLESMLTEMRELSEIILNITTEGVPKRARKKQ
jgi:hypothetical protein